MTVADGKYHQDAKAAMAITTKAITPAITIFLLLPMPLDTPSFLPRLSFGSAILGNLIFLFGFTSFTGAGGGTGVLMVGSGVGVGIVGRSRRKHHRCSLESPDSLIHS